MKQEVFEIKDYLDQIDAPQGFYDILTDLIVNKSISHDEVDKIVKHKNAYDIICNYQLRGVINV